MDSQPGNYLDQIRRRTEKSRIWDYLRYDDEGYLWVNGLRLVDAARLYGTPLEIVDTTIVEARCAEFERLVRAAAAATGFRGGYEFFHAAKSNMSAEIIAAANRAG